MLLYKTDSTMEKMVTADLGRQASSNGGANGSTLVDTTFLHPKVRDLAFAASHKAQKIILKQAVGFKRNANTGFRSVI